MWETISSKVVHKNNWYSIHHKKFRMPNKKIGDYFILDTGGSVAVIPLKNNKIILEKIYRYPVNKWTIEVVAGSLKKGLSYLNTAKEELEEELGYKAKSFKKIGTFAPFTGICSEICVVYLATELSFVGCKKEETEHIKAKEFSIKEVYKIIDEGKVIDGMTLSALSLARKYLLVFLNTPSACGGVTSVIWCNYYGISKSVTLCI